MLDKSWCLRRKRFLLARRALAVALCLTSLVLADENRLPYPIVGTQQTMCYGLEGPIQRPSKGGAFFGQDANWELRVADYVDNNDGTVTDRVTGLVWVKNMGRKMTLAEAQAAVAELRMKTGKEWRIPTIKELFSLSSYKGRVMGPDPVEPFIDTRYFDQPVGDTAVGERGIDAQTWSCTPCKGLTMGGDESQFGMNFVDGRIKAYPLRDPRSGQATRMYFRFVRGNPVYGLNDFVDNGDDTITDRATGLMWQKHDSGHGMDWTTALDFAGNQKTAGHEDWRLPSVKELQSLVDYSVSFRKDRVPAISPLFICSRIRDPEGNEDVPYYWTGTTLQDGPSPGDQAAYVVFGTAMAMPGNRIVDAHGSGAVRCDPKTPLKIGEERFFGPQSDYRSGSNFVRCVRKAP